MAGAKQPYIYAKVTYTFTNELYAYAKEPYIYANDYDMSREKDIIYTCIHVKKKHTQQWPVRNSPTYKQK